MFHCCICVYGSEVLSCAVSAFLLKKPSAGSLAVRGAFVSEDLNLGGTVIPSGSQLVAVNDKTTKDMEFEAAKALAMTGTLGTVLRFE